ncbi:uncharacterized protein ISCGN_032005 [Ixodes scapularis]
MRQSFTVEQKVEVVRWYRKAGSKVSKTAHQFGLDRKQVRQWKSTYETLLQECHGKGKFKRSVNSGRPVFSEEIDDGLFEFLQEERAAGRAVSNRLLREQARKLAPEAKVGNFNASSQHLSRWKKRFNVSLPAATNNSQKLPIDYEEAVSAFQRTLGTLHLQHD